MITTNLLENTGITEVKKDGKPIYYFYNFSVSYSSRIYKKLIEVLGCVLKPNMSVFFSIIEQQCKYTETFKEYVSKDCSTQSQRFVMIKTYYHLKIAFEGIDKKSNWPIYRSYKIKLGSDEVDFGNDLIILNFLSSMSRLHFKYNGADNLTVFANPLSHDDKPINSLYAFINSLNTSLPEPNFILL